MGSVEGDGCKLWLCFLGERDEFLLEIAVVDVMRDLDNSGGDTASHPCQPKLETLSKIRTSAALQCLDRGYLLAI